jgi:hypothetical protein
MSLASFDPWVALVKEWQPILAGLLVMMAAIILGYANIIAAKIRSAGSNQPEKPAPRDLRSSINSRSSDAVAPESISSNLEKLRSLVRSALSLLSSVDTDQDAARAICARIAAFQWQQFPIAHDADKRTQELFATFLNQFEPLRNLLRQEWSSSEASSILIQLNASARALYEALNRAPSPHSTRADSNKRD